NTLILLVFTKLCKDENIMKQVGFKTYESQKRYRKYYYANSNENKG
ncbi:integrase, partial [Bacillus anthracis]|nr:integrase [Bacillus anthracis]